MNICVRCRGKDPSLCGKKVCPIIQKISSQVKVNIQSKQDFFGASPNIFVGRFGYPNINVGILGNEGVTSEHDNPLLWSKENYEIPRIIDLRSYLINSQFKTHIKTFNEKLLEMSQEISMASRPVDVEINLEKKPQFSLSLNQDASPHGPNVRLKKARITENPQIPKKIEKTVSDTDLKASEAITSLYEKEVDEHYLTKLLSVGNLGIKTERKLVPTRWSITAVDDTIGKNLVGEIKNYETANYISFFGGHLGNYYLIMFFPEVWSYELFETYLPRTVWNNPDINIMTDYEAYEGRKDYAQNTVGGYYAARLGILERLIKMKKQASVLALRFITSEYYAPLGVWVVREATRKTMGQKPLEFDSKELMLNHAKLLIRKKFGYDAEILFQKSLLLANMKNQKKLSSFF